MAFNREAFFTKAKAVGIERDEVFIPEIGGSVIVRGMSGTERDKFEESLRLKAGKRAGQTNTLDFRAKYVAKVVENPDQTRMFNDGPSDIAFLGGLPSGVLDKIIAKSNELSGKSDEAVEVLGEGSEPEAASGASASSSPAN